MVNLIVDDRIFYHGDMANEPGTGIIKNIDSNQWGTNIFILMDDGREMNIPSNYFSQNYSGNASTPFVKFETYENWRKNLINPFNKN